MQISEASAKIGTGVPEVFQCCAIGSPILARATHIRNRGIALRL
jgi:hypothetical protein